jgi:hypothetical protein
MSIEIDWTEAMEAAWLKADLFKPALEATLEVMEPDARRELAAQLLRSANETEGHDVQ